MPLNYRIDHESQLVLVSCYGTFVDRDIFDYQRAVWSRPDVAGYNELVDMTHVTKIEAAGVERVHELAAIAAGMDSPSEPSKFAIVAPSDLAFGLGRMFQTFRELNKKSTKKISVSRTMKEAVEFLGLDRAPALPPVE
jgi:hypothetical protein